MSLRDDVRWVRDAADSMLHGGLPSWPPAWTTREGEHLAMLVADLHARWFGAAMDLAGAQGESKALRAEVDAERSTNERLTAEVEALRARETNR